MRRANADQPVRFLPRQPPVAFDLTGEQADQRKTIDPLPLIPRRAQQVAAQRQIAIDRRWLVAALELFLNDRPDHVTRDFVERPGAQVRVQHAADTLQIAITPQ